MKQNKQKVAPRARQTKSRKSSRMVVRKQPVSISSETYSRSPKVKSNGSFTVSHRELVYGPISAPGANTFWVKKFILNAGNPTTFRWLSNVAISYDRYQFKRMRFIYVPSCSTLTDGNMSMSFDPNAADPLPSNNYEIMGMKVAATGSNYAQLELEIPSKILQDRGILYMKAYDTVPVLGTDLRLFDLGNLFLSPFSSSTGNLGHLYVEYEIQLFDMQIPKLLDKIPQSHRSFKMCYENGKSSKTLETELWSWDPITIGVYTNPRNIDFLFNKRGEWLVVLYLKPLLREGEYTTFALNSTNMTSVDVLAFTHDVTGTTHKTCVAFSCSNVGIPPELGSSAWATAPTDNWWNNQEVVLIVSQCASKF